MNIILCGMMGVGKTTVGVKIAERSRRRWCDTDDLIVEKHGKISDIFARYGEEYFRDLETETVRGLSQEDGLVISVGGGLVLKKENNELLKANGKIIFLRATVQTLLSRLQADTSRPLLQNFAETLEEKLTRLLKERTPVYESVADYIVDVDEKNPTEIAEEIAALF